MIQGGRLERTIRPRKEVVTFYAIKADFSHYNEGWRTARAKMRSKLDHCEWCGEPFGNGDQIALGFRTTKKNMVLCQGCANAAQKGATPDEQ